MANIGDGSNVHRFVQVESATWCGGFSTGMQCESGIGRFRMTDAPLQFFAISRSSQLY